MSRSGTTLRMSSAYHLQTDGQTEVVNKTIKHYLRTTLQDHPREWRELLPWAELWYNTTFHGSIGMTPFQALYGRQPPDLIDYRPGDTVVQEVDRRLTMRDEILRTLKLNLQIAWERMKRFTDEKRTEKEFDEGEWVCLRLHPFHQCSVARREFQKLSKKFFGPYRIVKKISSVAYRLALPEGSSIHPVFHISLLKPFRGDDLEAGRLDLPKFACDSRWQ